MSDTPLFFTRLSPHNTRKFKKEHAESVYANTESIASVSLG